jgi:hypothetical protein
MGARHLEPDEHAERATGPGHAEAPEQRGEPAAQPPAPPRLLHPPIADASLAPASGC